jgi:hypothetical protein
MQFKVNDKVRISKQSEYYNHNTGNNPKDIIGTIEHITYSANGNIPYDSLCIRVNWSNGGSNSYAIQDLELYSILPNCDIVLEDANPTVVNLIIQLFKSLNIPIYQNTNSYDFNYPNLKWCSKHKYLTQNNGIPNPSYHKLIVSKGEDFIKYFTGELSLFEPVGLGYINDNKEYPVTIINKNGDIKVGCQEISYKKLEEIYKASKTVIKKY